MKIKSLILFAVIAAAVGCKEKKAEQVEALPFPEINVPEMLQEPQDRAEYVAEHWWDRFLDKQNLLACDSLLVNGVLRTEVEQKFANWIQALSMSRYESAKKAVQRLYERAAACEARDTASAVFEEMTSLVEKYLYDPNSPMRNEDLYGPYAECLATSPFVEDGLKPAYANDAHLCALNRVGTKAADFRFSDAGGRIRHLYDIKADRILLFFSNPGCNACMEIINALESNPVISAMLESGVLAVLNIYIDGDIEEWKSYMPVYPEEWYNGFDPDFIIRTDLLYNVRAIPSLYILDRDFKVIMKDAVTEKALDYLEMSAQGLL